MFDCIDTNKITVNNKAEPKLESIQDRYRLRLNFQLESNWREEFAHSEESNSPVTASPANSCDVLIQQTGVNLVVIECL